MDSLCFNYCTYLDGVRVTPRSYDANTGQNIEVLCTVNGEPFEGWYTPKGLKITGDDGMYVQGRGNDYILVVAKVEEMHGGKYTCRGGFSSAVHELNIKRRCIEENIVSHNTLAVNAILGHSLPNVFHF